MNVISKPYDAGLVCGRFQLFHKGHEHLVDTALKLCDRVLIFVGSSQEQGTKENPLSVSTRIKMLNEVYSDNPNVIIHDLPDLNKELTDDYLWGRYMLNTANRYLYKNPEVMVYGNDKPYTLWFDENDLGNTSIFIINRHDIPISATSLRLDMAADRRKEWMYWTNPRLHKYYEELRSELMSVDYYKTVPTEIIEFKIKGD